MAYKMPHTAACGPCVSGPAAAMTKSSARARGGRVSAWVRKNEACGGA